MSLCIGSDYIPGTDKFTSFTCLFLMRMEQCNFEYIDGKTKIHPIQCMVMTNSPAFDQQLALNEYSERYTRSYASWNQPCGQIVLFSACIISRNKKRHNLSSQCFSVIRKTFLPVPKHFNSQRLFQYSRHHFFVVYII